MKLDEMLDEWEQRREDDHARGIFGDDDEVGYYDYDNYDDDKLNNKDAICLKAFNGCQNRNL